MVCNKKKDCGPGCYPCGCLKVQCSHIATGGGGRGSSEDDLVAVMEDIRDDNKIEVDMWTMELSQRAILEEWIVKLLEEQCIATSLMH
jgi:hypothetical protein